MERRKSQRVRCRLACEIQATQKRAKGTVLDMSEGGLALQAGVEFDQGDTLTIRIQVPGKSLEVEAIVWHSRTVRLRGARENSWAMGLMLAKAPDEYYRFVPRGDVRPARSGAAAGTSDEGAAKPAAEAEPADEAPEMPAFRIRVKQLAGPRTRVLSLNAESEDEARAIATKDLEQDWEILEVWEV